MTDSFSTPDHPIVSDIKEAISLNRPDPSMKEAIISSWARSQEYGIDPHPMHLPSTAAADYGIDKWPRILDFDSSFYQVFSLFLQGNNCAVFYIDLELNIFRQDGNKQLLQQLNSVNLGVGTNLSEQNIGTNAAALAARSNAKVFVEGPEHYHHALKYYACEASPLFITDHIPIVYVMYVAAADSFDAACRDKLEYFKDLNNRLLQLVFNNLKLSMQNHMLKLGIDSRECGLIFTDNQGLIIYVNKWTMSYFNIQAKDVIGKTIHQTFPEFIEALDCFQSKNAVQNREITLQQHIGKECRLFVECHPMEEQNGNSEVIICFGESKPPQKSSAKKLSHCAHFEFNDLIGSSTSFLQTKNMAKVASVSNCNVMIIGESGSGKELFAQAIHNNSDRRKEPFVSINCAAIPKELIYSELFGYVEGAFTGAKKGGAAGKFELANRGTLFLDEISEIPTEMQAVLLRVLEDDTVCRLGSSVSTPIDVRIIAASNRDICNAVASNDFRLDLYHRLCTVRIDIAPLRRRKEDIPVLADYYLKLFNSKHNKNIRTIVPEAIEFMQNCLWLGNVRELRNVIERGVIFCSSRELTVDDLPKELMKHHKDPMQEIQRNSKLGDGLIQQFQEKLDEKSRIEYLLKKHNNNKTMVAQELEITRATLYRKMKLLGI